MPQNFKNLLLASAYPLQIVKIPPLILLNLSIESQLYPGVDK